MSYPEPIDSMVHPRSSGIATSMRLPLISDTRDLDVVFVGVPFDTSAGYRVGARLAPRAIRNCSSQVRTHHPIHDVTVHKNLRPISGRSTRHPRRHGIVERRKEATRCK